MDLSASEDTLVYCIIGRKLFNEHFSIHEFYYTIFLKKTVRYLDISCPNQTNAKLWVGSHMATLIITLRTNCLQTSNLLRILSLL